MFLYQIGDILALKAASVALSMIESEIRNDPLHRLRELDRFVVVERQLRECSGGTQLGYLCRYRLPDGSFATTWLTESELEPYPTDLIWDIWQKIINEKK